MRGRRDGWPTHRDGSRASEDEGSESTMNAVRKLFPETNFAEWEDAGKFTVSFTLKKGKKSVRPLNADARNHRPNAKAKQKPRKKREFKQFHLAPSSFLSFSRFFVLFRRPWTLFLSQMVLVVVRAMFITSHRKCLMQFSFIALRWLDQ